MTGLAVTDSLSSKRRGRISTRGRIMRVDILRIIIRWGGRLIMRIWSKGIIGMGWIGRIRWRNLRKRRCLGSKRIRISKLLRCFVGIIKA